MPTKICFNYFLCSAILAPVGFLMQWPLCRGRTCSHRARTRSARKQPKARVKQFIAICKTNKDRCFGTTWSIGVTALTKIGTQWVHVSTAMRFWKFLYDAPGVPMPPDAQPTNSVNKERRPKHDIVNLALLVYTVFGWIILLNTRACWSLMLIAVKWSYACGYTLLQFFFFWLTISKTTTITTKFCILNKLALLVPIVVNVFLKISYEEHIKRNCPL